jgi:hypothetical protein
MDIMLLDSCFAWLFLWYITRPLFFKRPAPQEKTLARNGDDSFINGIMWADVGNDL